MSVSPTSSTASAISFTGISSGLDTDSIVSALISAESQPRVLLQQQQTILNDQVSTYRDISTKLLTLKSAADDLRSFTLYSGSPNATSTDSTRLTALATASAAPGTYDVNVTSLAAANVKEQTASSFTSQFGALHAGSGVYAGSGTLLTSLTQADGTSLGYTAGSTITLNGSQNGNALTASTFTVTSTTTVDDLRTFIQTNLPGATATLGLGGALQITSPPGDEQAYTNLQLTATAADGTTSLPGIGATNPPAPTGSLGSVRVHGTGNVHLDSAGVGIDISVTDGESMDDVATAINAKNGSIQATTANGILRLTSKATGASSAITMTPDAGVSLGSFSDLVSGSDATGTVGGKAFTSSSNTVTNALTGVTLNLQATTTTPVSLNVNPTYVDNDAIVDKVKTFVTAYNDVITSIEAKTTELPVQNATTDADRVKGDLFGDSTLNELLDQLRDGMSGVVDGLANGQNLASSVGLSTGAVGSTYSADLVSGKLTLDESKLRQALAGGTDLVKKLFSTNAGSAAGDGLMQRMSDVCWNATITGGLVTSAIDGGTSESADMTTRLKDMQDALDARQATLKAQFTAMETALANLKSQGSSLASYTGTTSSG
jgi:flagellar hook-associated protein 2